MIVVGSSADDGVWSTSRALPQLVGRLSGDNNHNNDDNNNHMYIYIYIYAITSDNNK